MKTYVLDKIASRADAVRLLSAILPAQSSQWLLLAETGDAIAYFNVVETDVDMVGPAVTADISGRHYNEDRAVINILEQLQQKLGGEITCAA